jgi:hypothetical protein
MPFLQMQAREKQHMKKNGTGSVNAPPKKTLSASSPEEAGKNSFCSAIAMHFCFDEFTGQIGHVFYCH